MLEVGLDLKNESVFFSKIVNFGAGGRTRFERSENRCPAFSTRLLKRGAGGRTRTYEARKREIYSLLSLPLDDSSNNPIIPKASKKANN